MKILFNNQFYSLLAFGSQWGLAFIAFLLLIRTLSPENLGIWILYMTLVTIAEQARNGLIQNGYITFLKTEKYTLKVLQASALLLSIGFGVLMSILLLIVALILSWTTQAPELFHLSLVYPFYVIGSSILRVWESHCIGSGEFLKVALTKFTYGFCFIIAIIIAERFSVLNIQWLPFFQIISLALSFSLALCLLPISFGLNDYNRKYVQELIDYGRYVLGTNIGSILINKVDIFILGLMLGPVGVAFYNAASKLVNVAEIPLTSISQVVFPKISQVYYNSTRFEAGQLIERSTVLILAVMIPICLILGIFSETALVIVAGEEYRSSAIILEILAYSAIIKSIGRIFGISLDAIGRPKINYRLILASICVNVSLNFILFPFFGIKGVAIATLLSLSFGSILSFYYLKKDIPIQFVNILYPLFTFYLFFNKTKQYETSLRA
jgi:O-antigen/teichoic acid export membrane protein